MGTEEATPLFLVINNVLQEFAAGSHPMIPQYRLNTHPLLKKTLKMAKEHKKVKFSEKLVLSIYFSITSKSNKSSIKPKAEQNSESEVGRKKCGKLQFLKKNHPFPYG